MTTTYTSEQIRGAVLRAADRIEAGAPYDWANGYIRPQGDPFGGCNGGCMLHYVGMELGMRGVTVGQVAYDIGIRCSETGLAFYADHELYRFGRANGFDIYKPDGAVATLRSFADKHWPEPVTEPTTDSRSLIPWSECVWRPRGVALVTEPVSEPTP